MLFVNSAFPYLSHCKHLLWAFVVLGSMSACGSPSVSDFIEDEELLQATLDECTQQRDNNQSIDNEHCNIAAHAKYILIVHEIETELTRLIKATESH